MSSQIITSFNNADNTHKSLPTSNMENTSNLFGVSSDLVSNSDVELAFRVDSSLPQRSHSNTSAATTESNSDMSTDSEIPTNKNPKSAKRYIHKAGLLIISQHPKSMENCVLLGLNRYQELDIFAGIRKSREHIWDAAVRELYEESYNKIKIPPYKLQNAKYTIIQRPKHRIQVWCVPQTICPKLFDDITDAHRNQLPQISQEILKMVYIPISRLRPLLNIKNVENITDGSNLVTCVDHNEYKVSPRTIMSIQGLINFPTRIRSKPTRITTDDCLDTWSPDSTTYSPASASSSYALSPTNTTWENYPTFSYTASSRR